VVSVGDLVLTGSVIARSSDPAVPPVHASISGTVTEISMRSHPFGHSSKCVIIESDGGDKWVEPTVAEDLQQDILEKGIIESYGLHRLDMDRGADTVILNGTDHRPYVFVDKAIMLEERENVIVGLNLLMEAVGAKRGVIGINSSDINLIDAMRHEAVGRDIEIVGLKKEYTRGMGRLLSRDLSRQLKSRFKRAIVSRVPTARAVYQAVELGLPFVESYLSVYGAAETAAVKARIGTSFQDVVGALGGYTGTPSRIVMNSPMTGSAQHTDSVPVIRATYALMIDYDVSIEEPGPCIRCAQCVDVCPVNLLPNMLGLYSRKGKFAECRRYHARACIECGYCSYTCPSKIPLMQLIRHAKESLGVGD